MILELKHIYKDYHSDKLTVPVLKDVSLQVGEGEYVAIMGPSGSGKTTLMNIIGCLDRQTKGEFYLAGTDVLKLKDKELSNLRLNSIGFVFQSFHLMPRESAMENVSLPLSYAGIKKKERKERALKALARVGLEERATFMPTQLSGGQKQRVAIARALATNPKILLCDEATSALDPTTTKSILALLKDINEKYGITIIIITHEMAVVQEICTHVAIIDGGSLAETGTVEEVFARPKTEAEKKLVFQNGGNYDEMKGKHCIRIVFKENSSFEPVIGNMVLECKAPANILLADTKDIGGVAHGQMVLQLPEDEITAGKMINYLKERKLEVEELDNYVG